MSSLRAPYASLAAISAAVLAATVPASAQGAEPFATFAPTKKSSSASIDYDVWNEAVQNIVISMGPSLRQAAGRPQEGFGTRRVYGHTSRYRLEGTRVTFSFLDKTIIGNLAQYRQELQATPDKVDLQSLSRNEQLAFWINLHNVALVEKIAENWPTRQPRNLKIDGVPIDEAKFITVEGVSMSLKDIRENVVYANWDDPMVMYGFWRGEIGSPSIQRQAFTGENVARLLDRSAREFVNSLRGTQKSGDTLEVSAYYEEVAPFFFPDFESDVRAHIAQYAQEDVSKILAETGKAEATITEYDIADLAGGAREPTYTNLTTAAGNVQSFRIPRSMTALLAQREEKFRRILKEGRSGTVTFSELKLPGDEGEEGEVK